MTRSLSHPLFLLALSFFLSGASLASNGSQYGAFSIEAYEAPVEDILKTFAEMNRAELELDPGVMGRVSLGAGAISWTTALDLVCESVGCRWSLTGPQPRTLTVEPREASRPHDPINLHLEDADPGKVLRSFGRILERETFIEGDLRGGVTFLFQGVSPITALTAACESLGCLWELGAEKLRIWVVPDPVEYGSEKGIFDALFAPISMSLKDADARAVLSTFEAVMGCPVEIDASIAGQVSVELENTPTEAVLTALCDQLGCRWFVSERQGSSILVIEPFP